MKQGAIAMIDALGFRGIWNDRPDVKADEDTFLGGLRDLRQRAEADAAKLSSSKGFLSAPQVTFLSDTIVIAIAAAVESQVERNIPGLLDLAVAVAVNLVPALLRSAAAPPVKLAFRGCVSVGAFVVEEHILMGPAIDEAASLHELAQGALVWLAPSALNVVARSRGGPTARQSAAIPWSVPLKEGGTVKSLVVSPFVKGSAESERRAVREAVLATFNAGMGRLDVTIKRQHTEAFLDEAESVAAC